MYCENETKRSLVSYFILHVLQNVIIIAIGSVVSDT